MDPKNYSIFRTSRNLQYNVFYVKATSQATTIVFLHGFPNSSYDWRYQVEFFTKLGYGVIVPDLLGYGGTDKPLDVGLYKISDIAQDVVDVIDQLKVGGPLVAIGHDWGSTITGRLANNHQGRFGAFAFLAVGYMPPNPSVGYQDILESTTKIFGRELFGYWTFFSAEDADEIIRQHYDAFWDVVFAFEPNTIKVIATTTGFRSYLPQNIKTKLPDYLTPEEAAITKENFRNTGIKAPLNWYKFITSDLAKEDAAAIPQENYKINKPVFFAGALNDAIAVPAMFEASIPAFVSQPTTRKYEASHWVHWEKRAQLNQDLKNWLDTLTL